jgi:hypothetical protein
MRCRSVAVSGGLMALEESQLNLVESSIADHDHQLMGWLING